MAEKPKTEPWKRKLTMRLLCSRYGVCDRTIDRWTATGVLPKPMTINRIRFWDEEEIEQRDRERMAEANNTACRGNQDELADVHADEAA
jgi:predicted DNA-binding transcriptional regulator AlpA